MSFDYQEGCNTEITRIFQRKHCVLTGNGTTALTVAFKMATPDRPRVLLPAMACYNVLLAAHFAGKIPVFADVLSSDATLDPAVVERALKRDPEIGAVLIVHLYGHAAKVKDIIELCRRHHVIAIEDPAQAMGGFFHSGERLGSLGDLTIVSFGHTKILDAGGGGALLFDDSTKLQTAQNLVNSILTNAQSGQYLEHIYRQLYYDIWDAGKKDNRFYTLFDNFPGLFRNLFIFRMEAQYAKDIYEKLPGLDKSIADRHSIAEIYRSELSGIEKIRLFTPGTGSVPWRFSFLLDEDIRDKVLIQVRQKGFDISSWYPCYTDWAESGRNQDSGQFPVAKRLEKEIVNLWVAEGINSERALATVHELKQAIKSCIGVTNQ